MKPKVRARRLPDVGGIGKVDVGRLRRALESGVVEHRSKTKFETLERLEARHLSPSVTSTVLLIHEKALGRGCCSMPADWMRNRKERALPSMSDLRPSEIDVGIIDPEPANADMRCSTVAFRPLASSALQSRVS